MMQNEEEMNAYIARYELERFGIARLDNLGFVGEYRAWDSREYPNK